MIYPMIFAILFLGAIWCAVMMSVADFRRRIIPDVYLFPFLLIGLVLTTFWGWPTDILDGAIGAVGGYAITTLVGFLFARARRRGADKYPPIGMGDIKLVGAGGLWLGPMGLDIAILAACVTGIIWARRKKAKYIPFAPFFFIGVIIALIIRWILI